MRCLILIGITLVLLTSCAKKPVVTEIPAYPQDQFLVREGKFGDDSFRYRVFVPADRKPGERVPVLLYLHGSDDRGDDNELQLRGLAEHVKTHPQDFRFIIVFPQCRLDRFWDKGMIQQAMAALDQTVREFDVDENRLYLAGFSLGGYAVWTTSATYPGKFTAIVPMSGRVLPRSAERKNIDSEIIELVDAADPYAAFANRIGKVPIWVFHGAEDNIVPLEGSRKMIRALKDAGNENVVFSELQGVGHYTVDTAMGNKELFNWLSKQHLAVQK